MCRLASVLTLTLGLAVSATAGDLDDARKNVALGRFEEAESQLVELLDQGDDDVRLLLGEARVGLGRGLAALEVLDPLMDRDDAHTQLVIGRAFLFAGDELADSGAPGQDVGYYYEMALDTLSRAAELAPRNDVAAALEAGWLALYDFGDHERAAKLAELGLRKAPGHGELLLLQGCSLVNAYAAEHPEGPDAKESNTAKRLWKDAFKSLTAADEKLGETSGEAALQLSWLHEARGEAAQAVAEALRHVERSGADATGVLYRLARRYADAGDWENAWAALDGVLRFDLDNLVPSIEAEEDPTAAAVSLGWATSVLVERGQRAEARNVLGKLLETEPERASIWNDYAFLCRETGLYEASYEAYERAVALDPENPRLLNDTALILQYHLRRDLGRARELYESAIAVAERLLDADDPATDRASVRLALTDARNNLGRLR